MTEYAEPATRKLLASDHDRDRVADRVRTAAADGRIELAEVEQRIAEVYQSKTHAELEIAGRGLPEPGPRDALVVDREPTSRFALGVFGGYEREGEWVLPPRFLSWSMFGGGRLDLTEARFSNQDTELWAVALWGGTEIVVPDDIEVKVKGFGLFGLFGKRAARGGGGKPGTPRLVIKGVALWGAVVTKSKAMGNRHQQR
ncbi:DUF1707 domain-containing protein [Streptomyces sp. E11-3]|uniref:DUF1707 SHOCT-like domain-containing protein n=1 Tax=Streptomyces sp. E11-3 TaxID=3110112 RepID=UPI0039801709